jgi:hypothetical protein
MDRNGKMPSKGTHLMAMMAQLLSDINAQHVLVLETERAKPIPEPTVMLPATLAAAKSKRGKDDEEQEMTQPAMSDEHWQTGLDGSGPQIRSPDACSQCSTVAFSFTSLDAAGSGSQSSSFTPTASPQRQVDTATTAMLGVTESDLLFLYRIMRHTIDAVLTPKECVDVAQHPDTIRVLNLLQAIAPFDFNTALYALSLVSNLCAVKEGRQFLSGTTLFNFVLQTSHRFRESRRLVHLALMTLSNVALLPSCDIPDHHLREVVLLVIPLYFEPQVVEAWLTCLTNFTASHPRLIAPILEYGAVDTIERLLLFLGDDSRLVSRGLYALSNLSTGFANRHT